MKKFSWALLPLLIALAAMVSPVHAQAAPHAVTLTWNDTSNPAGTTYNVYRATGLCSGAPMFSVIQSAVAVKTFKDATVGVGNFCYKVTAVFTNIESSGSNTVNPVVAPFDVTLNATVP